MRDSKQPPAPAENITERERRSAASAAWRAAGFLLLAAVCIERSNPAKASAVILARTPETLTVVADSKEVYTEYRDGVPTVTEGTTCKLVQAGSWYAVLSGIIRGTGGFDARTVVQDAYRPDDSFSAGSRSLETALSGKLASLMHTIRGISPEDFKAKYANQVILQVGLFGVENQTTQAKVLEFSIDAAETVSARYMNCPGDCRRYAYLLGVHDAMESALAKDSRVLLNPTGKAMQALLGAQYYARPDIVGGPVTTVSIERNGKTSFSRGACDSLGDRAAVLERIERDAQLKLAVAGRLSFHQESIRSTVTGHRIRKFEPVSADVEVLDGVEKYTEIRDRNANYANLDQMGGTWSYGEAAAILRLSLEVLSAESGTIQIQDDDPVLVWFRHASATTRWTFTIGGRVYPLAFTGKILFSGARSTIVKIEWTATDLPPETQVAEVRWSVNFGESVVGDRLQPVPQRGLYSVAWKSGRIDKNETLFSNFKSYGSDSAIRYDVD